MHILTGTAYSLYRVAILPGLLNDRPAVTSSSRFSENGRTEKNFANSFLKSSVLAQTVLI